MAGRLSSLQRQFYLNNTSGVSSQTPFGQLQRSYFMQYIITNEAGVDTTQVHQSGLNDLEDRWLKNWIVTNGGTIPENNYTSSLWRKAVEILNLTPSKLTSVNQMLFFTNAAS